MARRSLLTRSGAILFGAPLGFLIAFVILAGGWTLVVFKDISRELLGTSLGTYIMGPVPILRRLDDLLVAVCIVGIYAAGLLLAYNMSVLINWLFARYGKRSAPYDDLLPYRPSESRSKANLLKNFHKIGIVLAGGGAKGAFQAGALKAVYEFLAENDALDKVKVISATSIGSWNTMFWLADLIVSADNGKLSVHEYWWKSISLRSLLAPSWYVPGYRNAFCVTSPWRRTFDAIFTQPAVKEHIAKSKIHFYLTRSNVKSGLLECTTNNPNAKSTVKTRYHRASHSKPAGDFPTLVVTNKDADKLLQDIKAGVFASMDLPPLFPYERIQNDQFEDGGVIDNLPIQFAAMERCDLTFVLPLNSDFVADVNERSIFHRLFRVLDIRQGALERNSLKIQYLYNELAVLRDRVTTLEAKMSDAKVDVPPVGNSKILREALGRTHQQSRVFGICPDRRLVESTINTWELWKSKEADAAFSLMYRAAKTALSSGFDPSEERTIIALVHPAGNVDYFVDF